MKIKVLFISTILTVSNFAFADCTTTRPATAQDIGGGKAVRLVQSMKAACESNSPRKFFALQTSGIANTLNSEPSSKQTRTLKMYCDALSGAFSDPGSLVYTLEKDRSQECGRAQTLLWGKTQSGKAVFRMTVAVEKGTLKLNEF